MFGKRADGKEYKNIDPIVRCTPYIMKERSDAQVFMTLDCDYESCNEYIKKKKAEGIKNISIMTLIIAGYCRALSIRPELNRFVVGKKLYTRNQMSVFFAAVKKRNAEEVTEVTVKVYLDPAHDTVFTIADRIEKALENEVHVEEDNDTLKFVNKLLSVPGLPNFVFSLLAWLDRRGLVPQWLLHISPFHASMVITNMASIKMNKVYHHIYNFGSVGMFIGMGKRVARLRVDAEGKLKAKHVIPMGMVIDERLCSGATYAMAVHHWEHYMKHPEILEQPPKPEDVRFENGVEYHLDGDLPSHFKKKKKD